MEIRKFNLVDMVHVYLIYKSNYIFPELLPPGKNVKKDTSQRVMDKLLNEHYINMARLNKDYVNLNLIENIKKSSNPFLSMIYENSVHEDDIKNYNIRCFADFEAWMDFNYWNIKVIQEALDHPDYTLARKVMPDGTVHLSVPKSILGDYDGEMFNSKLKLKSVKVKKPKRKRK